MHQPTKLRGVTSQKALPFILAPVISSFVSSNNTRSGRKHKSIRTGRLSVAISSSQNTTHCRLHDHLPCPFSSEQLTATHCDGGHSQALCRFILGAEECAVVGVSSSRGGSCYLLFPYTGPWHTNNMHSCLIRVARDVSVCTALRPGVSNTPPARSR